MRLLTIRVARTLSDHRYGNRVIEVHAEFEVWENLKTLAGTLTAEIDEEFALWVKAEKDREEQRERAWKTSHLDAEDRRRERAAAASAPAPVPTAGHDDDLIPF